VQTFVAGYKLVGEGESGHETAFLEPEDGREGAAEEDTLDGSESDEALGEGGALVLDPFDGPIGFLADAGDYHALAGRQALDPYNKTYWCQWHRRGRSAASAP